MTQTDYEQKRRECWEEYKRQNLDGEVQWQLLSRYDVYCAAFDRAYALGQLQASGGQVKIMQEEIEKAAEKYDDQHTEKLIHDMHNDSTSWKPLQDGIRNAFLAGGNFAIGKQEKDADTVIQGWVAIDKDGCMWTFDEKPIRSEHNFWEGETSDCSLPRELFPDLAWESDPEQVEIIIKRKKK